MLESLKTFFNRRFARRPVDRTAHALYVTAVEAGRTPALFETGRVADTVDGRFDMIILHLALLIERLRQVTPDGEAGKGARELETRILEVHFADMDQALREMGVGDLGVGKRVKVMAKALMGRRVAYGAALEVFDEKGDRAPLRDALVRNAYRGEAPEESVVDWLVDYVLRERTSLTQYDLKDFIEASVVFSGAATLSDDAGVPA